MAWRCGSSLSRSLISTVRSSLPHSPPPPLPRNLSSSSSASRRRSLFSLPANVEQLACAQSLLPLHSAAIASARLTSHVSAAAARAFCELSQGT